jgi:hypothetical protein
MTGKLTLVLTKTIKGDDLEKVADAEMEEVKAAVKGYEVSLDDIEELDDDAAAADDGDDDDDEETATPND